MDAGEFGLGANTMELVELNDNPRYTYYMDGVFATADGRPFIQHNMICIFERYVGDNGWRHSEVPYVGFNVGNNSNDFASKVKTSYVYEIIQILFLVIVLFFNY